MHLLRCAVWLTAVASSRSQPLLCALAAAGLFFAVFSLFHDAAHGALLLPQRLNNVVLVLTSIPLLMPAHGQRQLHLRHHAHPLGADDLEGVGATLPFVVALLLGPVLAARMRVFGHRTVPRGLVPIVMFENTLNGVVIAAILVWGGEGLQLALAMGLLLHISMSAWASYVPHNLRTARWLKPLLRVAPKLLWTRSPVVASLVLHDAHHASPKVPCGALHEPSVTPSSQTPT